MRNNWYLFF